MAWPAGRLEGPGGSGQSSAYIASMVFDLGLAMRKKEEFESARLMDFDFRLRARAIRLLANHLGRSEEDAAQAVASMNDAAAVEHLSSMSQTNAADATALHTKCLSEARAELIAERGDPTPYRLA